MAHVEKRQRNGRLEPTGWFYIDVRHPTLGRHRQRFKTLDLAVACETHIRAHGEVPQWALSDDPDAKDVRTFQSVYAELKDAGGPNGVWLRARDRSVHQRLAYACGMFGSADIKTVGYQTCEKLVLDLRKRPGQRRGTKMSNAAINRYLSAISSVLKYAAQKGYITGKPVLPWQKEAKWSQKLYTDTMITGLVNALEAQGYKAEALCIRVLAAPACALRAGELLTLRPEQIEDEFIVLNDAEALKNGETGEVYIGGPLARELRATIVAGAMPRYDTLYDRVAKTLKSSGQEMPRPLHALRHTTASRTVNAGLDIQVAQELLRHKNLKTTLRYRKVSREVLRERAKKLAHDGGQTHPQPSILPFPPKQNQGDSGAA